MYQQMLYVQNGMQPYMTRVTIRLSQDVVEAISVCGGDIGRELGEVASNSAFGHQVLQ